MTIVEAIRTTIWWIRRDLRLSDNQALKAALAHAERVIPLFVLDPALLKAPTAGTRRPAFLLAGLQSLDADLRARGSRLIVRQGDPAEQLARLAQESGAAAVFAEADHSNYARRRDQEVARQVNLQLVGSPAARPPGAVLKQDGTPYTVFTPFSRAWLNLPLPRVGDLLPAPPQMNPPGEWRSEPIPDGPQPSGMDLFPASEAEARRRLAAFAGQGIYRYGADRNRVDLDGTSRLSPYLRFGMMSAGEAVAVAADAAARAGKAEGRQGANVWLNELIWRDFYIHILYHFPYVGRASFRPDLGHIAWRNDPEEYDAWRRGQTGFPIVDAAMRQLLHTGWIHNRVRMIVASFLVKDLLIDWRWGERWFMEQLIDGDPAANNGGWQWTAGTGTDAAPYFRIFNPVMQGVKFDPDGAYVRRWVPELARVDSRTIHEPWRMSPAEQRAAGCVIGRDYPAPIVDHAMARERTLAAYAAAKGDAG